VYSQLGIVVYCLTEYEAFFVTAPYQLSGNAVLNQCQPTLSYLTLEMRGEWLLAHRRGTPAAKYLFKAGIILWGNYISTRLSDFSCPTLPTVLKYSGSI